MSASNDPRGSEKPYCANCRGDGWVCENHRSETQGHDDACSGAGEPCPSCNPLATEFSRVLHERDQLRAEIVRLRASGETTGGTVIEGWVERDPIGDYLLYTDEWLTKEGFGPNNRDDMDRATLISRPAPPGVRE